MNITVEPVDGPELDRLITAVISAGGVVARIIDSVGEPPGADGVEIIGMVADRMRESLFLMEEHRSDEELALVTEVLAELTLLVAGDLGLGAIFVPD